MTYINQARRAYSTRATVCYIGSDSLHVDDRYYENSYTYVVIRRALDERTVQGLLWVIYNNNNNKIIKYIYYYNIIYNIIIYNIIINNILI
jgi:hypothetical protein